MKRFIYSLQELLREKMDNSSKIVLTHRLTKDHYREVLNQITKDIYDKYKSYVLMREISTVAGKPRYSWKPRLLNSNRNLQKRIS